MSTSDAVTNALSRFQSSPALLTVGGIETTLLFRTDFPLRDMGAFEALLTPKWNNFLTLYNRQFADVALKYRLPIVLDTETWRASSNWFDLMGIPDEDRRRIYGLAVQGVCSVADYIHTASNGEVQAIVQGVIGPLADGYTADANLSLEAARAYHRKQIVALREAGVTLVAAFTLTTSTEAIAIAQEASDAGLACVISFTLDTDGLLPSKVSLKEAVEAVEAAAHPPPAFYMVNCVHPKYVRVAIGEAVARGEGWVQKLKGVKGNASQKSHEELDNCANLDEGVPAEWAEEMVALKKLHPGLSLIGGCCGTAVQHCEEVAKRLK